ncbi:MAG: cupin domain-containing protein [Haloarculaceae archaeon]
MTDDTETARLPWLFDATDERGIERELAPGLDARIFAGENSMLSYVEIEPHSEGRIHSHEEEQWGYLLEGACTRIQDGEAVDATAGDFWHTPGGTEHSIRTGDEGAVVLDIFSPPRPEYREEGEGFGNEK